MVSKASALSSQIQAATRPSATFLSDHALNEDVKRYKNSPEQHDAKATYNLAVDYQKGGNNLLAFQRFKEAADLGLPEAQLAAGICYYNGIGTPQSYAEALHLLQPLAEQGNKHAQYFLGDYHYYETENYLEAAKWYAEAADQNHVAALNNLGICYEKGHGVLPSDKKAFACYKKASAQFLPIALINQGRCCEEGRGTDANPNLASSLFNQATILGGEEAKYTIRVSSEGTGSDSASPAS